MRRLCHWGIYGGWTPPTAFLVLLKISLYLSLWQNDRAVKLKPWAAHSCRFGRGRSPGTGAGGLQEISSVVEARLWLGVCAYADSNAPPIKIVCTFTTGRRGSGVVNGRSRWSEGIGRGPFSEQLPLSKMCLPNGILYPPFSANCINENKKKMQLSHKPSIQKFVSETRRVAGAASGLFVLLQEVEFIAVLRTLRNMAALSALRWIRWVLYRTSCFSS